MILLAFQIAVVVVLVALFVPLVVWLAHLAIAGIGNTVGGTLWLIEKPFELATRLETRIAAWFRRKQGAR